MKCLLFLHGLLCAILWQGLNVNSFANVSTSVLSSEENVAPQPISSRTFEVNGVKFKMMRVVGGTFTMGAAPEVDDYFKHYGDRPTHLVTVGSFYIGETEVTQELWSAVMGENPSYFKGDKLPVECVSWEDCQKFLIKLQSMTGKRFRFPTEAEWEFAARGGNNTQHYLFSGSNNYEEVAWCTETSGAKTHNVALKQPNELGIYDMSGNVAEWCWDWEDKYSSEPQINPAGPENLNNSKVFRGGRFNLGRDMCCVSSRAGQSFKSGTHSIGLRLLLKE